MPEGSTDQFIHVIDAPDGHDAKGTQMGPDDQGLRIGVADNANALPAVELGQLRLEFRSEVAVFDVVDGPVDPAGITHGHAAPFRPQV